MVRVQVQFNDAQLEALRQMAAQTGRSVSDLAREAVDSFLERRSVGHDERARRALAAVGKFASDCDDVSLNHDRYFADAIEEDVLHR